MKNTLRTLRAVLIDGLRMLLFPIAHAVNDRILTEKEYERCLDWRSRTEQERRFLSVLSALRRAARRQERINTVGMVRFNELNARCHERAFAYLWHGRIVLFFLAIGYTGDALEHILRDYYPVTFILWMNLTDWLAALHNDAWRWIWEQMVQWRGRR